jgi:hypothetical protein
MGRRGNAALPLILQNAGDFRENGDLRLHNENF